MKDKGKNIFLAPAMNTAMWQHLITAEQIERLRKFGYNIILPIEKKLACGDLGKFLNYKILAIYKLTRNRSYGSSGKHCGNGHVLHVYN